MAVTKTLSKKSLRLLLDNGLTNDGKVKTKAKSYTNVNPAADNDSLYSVAKQIGSLGSKNLVEVETVETNTLTEA